MTKILPKPSKVGSKRFIAVPEYAGSFPGGDFHTADSGRSIRDRPVIRTEHKSHNSFCFNIISGTVGG